MTSPSVLTPIPTWPDQLALPTSRQSTCSSSPSEEMPRATRCQRPSLSRETGNLHSPEGLGRDKTQNLGLTAHVSHLGFTRSSSQGPSASILRGREVL